MPSTPNSEKNSTSVQPLPFGVYFWSVTAMALAGLADAAYLSVSHYRVYTDVAYESFCAISQAINCDTVSQSPYSIFLGMPVPVWGVIGYLFFLILLGLARLEAAEKRRMWPLLFAVALVFSLYSIGLALISTFLINSFCVMCFVSYAISFLLLFYTWLISKRFHSGGLFRGLKEDIRFLMQRKKLVAGLMTPVFAGVVLIWIFFPVYWYSDPPPLHASIPTGITADGHPWIGAKNADLVITEFADYLCFQCNKMHYYLRKLMVRFPGKIKIVHRHFPMDHKVNPIVKHPVHVGSGVLAMFAIYAGTKDRFWQMNDLLFANARKAETLNVSALAEAVGLDPAELARSVKKPEIWDKLRKDLAEGFKLGVTGTPTFIIDGQTYTGQIPREIITRIID